MGKPLPGEKVFRFLSPSCIWSCCINYVNRLDTKCKLKNEAEALSVDSALPVRLSESSLYPSVPEYLILYGQYCEWILLRGGLNYLMAVVNNNHHLQRYQHLDRGFKLENLQFYREKFSNEIFRIKYHWFILMVPLAYPDLTGGLSSDGDYSNNDPRSPVNGELFITSSRSPPSTQSSL